MPIVPDDAPAIVPDEEAPQGFADRLRSIRETLDASTQGIVRGIPVVGPMLDKVTSFAAAGGRPEAYKDIQGGVERVAAEHPVAAGVGNVAGSVVSTVPVARAAPALFGGSTFAGQTAAGGALGGADAFVRSGGDIDATKTGAAVGAAGPLMGQILAPIGQGIVSAGRAIKDYIPGVNKVLQPRILPASAEALEQSAERGYNELSRIAPYSPKDLEGLRTQIKQELYNQSKSGQIGAVDAHRILDTMDSLPPTAASLHTIRKELGKVAGGDEGHSARVAKDMIDKFMANPSPGALVVQGGAGNQGRAAKLLENANADYRSAMNMNQLRDRVTKAKLDAENSNNPIPFLAEGQATRKQAKQLLDSNKASRFLLDNEREAITDINRGSLGERGMRMLSSVSGTSRPGAFTMVTPLITGNVAGFAPAAAGVAAGVGASAATSALTRRAVNQAENVISANAPYSQYMMRQQLPPPTSMSPSVMPSSISAGAHRDEIARLMALQAERETTPGPRRIIIDTPSSVEERP